MAEHNKEDPRIRSLAQAHKKKVLAVIGSLVVQAGVSDPEAVTESIGILVDGTIIAAVITGTSEHARRGADAVRMILASQLPASQLPARRTAASHAHAA